MTKKTINSKLTPQTITFMANKNTRQARNAGFASKKDQNNNGTKVFKGSCCDTGWDAPASKHRSRKVYKKPQ